MTKKDLFIRILFSLALFNASCAWCQQVIKGSETVEIIKLAGVNRLEHNLSFNAIYKYADNASPANVLEQINGTYKLQDGKYKITLGEVTHLQGNVFNLMVYNEDSTIIVKETSTASQLLQLPLLDSLFRKANVDSMAVTAISDSVNRLSMFFRPNAYYAGYEVEYHKYKYRLYKIVYKIKEMADDESNPNPSGISRITMEFSGYSTAKIDPEEFNEDHYVYRTGNTFYTKPAYTGYKLVINVGN